MSQHNVEVRQIKSEYPGDSLLNVNADNGHIEVSGIDYKNPTYLLTSGIHFILIQFDSAEYAAEWIENNKDGKIKWSAIRIKDVGKILSDSVQAVKLG